MAYYRDVFRDGSTKADNRASSWNRIVAHYFIRTMPDVVLTDKQLEFRRGKDTARIVYDYKRSIQNEMVSLALCYQKKNGPTYIAQMRALLRAADKDIERRPPAHFPNLERLLNVNQNIEGEEMIRVSEVMPKSSVCRC